MWGRETSPRQEVVSHGNNRSSGGAYLAAVLLVLAGLVGLAGRAEAASLQTVSGDRSEPCRIDWTAAALNDWDLEDTDVVTWKEREHSRLMTQANGDPVDQYSNGGYLEEVGPGLGTEGGFLQMQHWYEPRATTSVNWRIPVAQPVATTWGGLTVTLPAGTVVNTVVDHTSYFAGDPARRPAFTNDYSWTSPQPWGGGNPGYAQTVLADGRVQLNFNIEHRDARSAFGIQITGTVPTGQHTQSDQIGEARYVATIPEGTATCPMFENGDQSSEPCEIDWQADATTQVNGAAKYANDNIKGVGAWDVHRDVSVAQYEWDPERPGYESLGVLRLDGWTEPDGLGGTAAGGRVVLAAWRPFENGVLDITLDSRIENPVFTELAPAPANLTDNRLYGQPVTVLDKTVDAAAGTATYRVESGGTLIRNSLVISYRGDVTDTHAINADYRSEATFTADWVPNATNPLCPFASDLTVDKSVRDSEAPFGAVTEGEEITYTFTVRNTGNQPLTDVTISDETISDEPIECVATLAPGAQASCTATYTVTAEDIEAGGVTNTATASGTGHDGVVTSEEDSVRIPADCECEDGSGSLGSLGEIAAGSLGSLDPESGSAGSAGQGSLGQSLELLAGSAALPLLGSLGSSTGTDSLEDLLAGSTGAGGSSGSLEDLLAGSTGAGGSSGSLEDLLAGSTGAGGSSGSLEDLVTGSVPLLGSLGSSAGSLPAVGSTTGSLALGAIAVGAIALGDSVSKGAFPLPPLPPLPTGSLPGGLPPLPFPLPGQPAQQAPQQGAPGAVPDAPGPVDPNGRG